MSNAVETAVETETPQKETVKIQPNLVSVGYSKTNSTPRFNFVWQANKTFVQSEVNRKHLAACYALMSEAQIQAYEMGVDSIKDFFTNNKIANYPTKIEHQTEVLTISQNWDSVSAKSIKLYRKKLAEVGELRDIKDVFAEYLEMLRTDTNNPANWKALLD